MTKAFIEPEIYSKLSNADLLKKQKEIYSKLSKVYNSNVPQDLVEDITSIANIIDAEVDKRLENNTMDEDEMDEDY